jgi:hypothetical protein
MRLLQTSAAATVAVSFTLGSCDAPSFSGTADPSVTAAMFARLARRWVRSIPPQVMTAYGEFAVVEKIVERFTGDALLAYREASSTAMLTLVQLWEFLQGQAHHDAGFHARRNLNLCKQAANESVEAFLARYRGLIAALPSHAREDGNSFLDDRDGLLTTFRLGLLPALSAKLIEKAPFKTTATLVKELRNIWAVKHPVHASASLSVAAARMSVEIWRKAVAAHPGKCFCCASSDHILPNCPSKASLPRKDWLFDTDAPPADF